MILMGKEEADLYWFIIMPKATKYYLCLVLSEQQQLELHTMILIAYRPLKTLQENGLCAFLDTDVKVILASDLKCQEL